MTDLAPWLVATGITLAVWAIGLGLDLVRRPRKVGWWVVVAPLPLVVLALLGVLEELFRLPAWNEDLPFAVFQGAAPTAVLLIPMLCATAVLLQLVRALRPGPKVERSPIPFIGPQLLLVVLLVAWVHRPAAVVFLLFLALPSGALVATAVLGWWRPGDRLGAAAPVIRNLLGGVLALWSLLTSTGADFLMGLPGVSLAVVASAALALRVGSGWGRLPIGFLGCLALLLFAMRLGTERPVWVDLVGRWGDIEQLDLARRGGYFADDPTLPADLPLVCGERLRCWAGTGRGMSAVPIQGRRVLYTDSDRDWGAPPYPRGRVGRPVRVTAAPGGARLDGEGPIAWGRPLHEALATLPVDQGIDVVESPTWTVQDFVSMCASTVAGGTPPDCRVVRATP